MIRDSDEYLRFTLGVADGADITGDVVQVALVAVGDSVHTATWLPATFLVGSTWRTTDPITFSSANYPRSTYRVYAKVSDSPEAPMALLGNVTITG